MPRTLILWFAPGAVGFAVVAMLGGCGTPATARGSVDARTSPYSARPRGTLIPSDFAVGGGSWSAHDGIGENELATYLKPEARDKAVRKHAPAEHPITPVRPEPMPALPPLPTVARAPERATRTEALHASLSEVPAANPDMPRYASREQRSRELANYRGGDVVLISTSTVVIVLIIVILVLLLT